MFSHRSIYLFIVTSKIVRITSYEVSSFYKEDTEMKHYVKNTNTVIQTLGIYGYSDHSIDLSRYCFSQLKSWMDSQEITDYDTQQARDWIFSANVLASHRPFFRSTIQRLIDVYDTGNILRSHIVFYSRILSVHFSELRDRYLLSINGTVPERQFRNISDTCNRFLGFLHVRGFKSVNEICYSTMPLYYQDLMQVNKTPNVQVNIIEDFLFFLAEQGLCSYGLGWYMFYYRSGKEPFGEKFTMQEAYKISTDCAQSLGSAEDVRKNIPLLIKELKKYQYSRPVLDSSESALKLLFILLDMSGVPYSIALADAWIEAEGRRLFKSSFGMARRGLELFAGLIKDGKINPFSYRKRHPSMVNLLPEWCFIAVDGFMKQRIKEGRKPKTVSDDGAACARFCNYLITQGHDDFASLTPAVIKAFNLQDCHKTPRGKNTYNGVIRRFLTFLYRNEFTAQPNLHLAIQGNAAPRERIVDILTENEQQQVQRHKEEGRSPLELRDAAIIELGLKMGFRGIDIVNLRFSDIDWKSRTIRLIQSKTSKEIWLPMDVSVGNAIYRYIKEGRPSVVELPYVFLKTRAPYGPVSVTACQRSIERVLPERDIPGSKFHATRRTYATGLLKKGVKTSLIADALGHSDIGTVHKYLLLDETRMRMCPLSLEEVGLSGRMDDE